MTESNEKKLRIIELVLIIAVAFLPSMIQSFYALIFNFHLEIPKDMNIYFLVGISQELIAISILVYILHRQGRKIDDIVAPFSSKDILHTIALIALSYIAYFLVYQALWLLSRDLKLTASNIEFMQKNITILYVLFILINPIFEELIVRGFLISEIVNITGKGGLAVIVSVLIQVSYHLYQGLIPAIMYGAMFLTFSLYFLKFKRIMPVIIAHAFFDITSMIYYAKV